MKRAIVGERYQLYYYCCYYFTGALSIVLRSSLCLVEDCLPIFLDMSSINIQTNRSHYSGSRTLQHVNDIHTAGPLVLWRNTGFAQYVIKKGHHKMCHLGPMNIVSRDKMEEENDIDLSFPGCQVWLPLVLDPPCYCSIYSRLPGRVIYEAKL